MTGSTISHYRVMEKIGSGGMGVVYRAIDLKLGRDVALKFLPDHVSRNRAAIERFEREAHTASALNNPGICTIYGIDEADGRLFIVMEFLQGRNLRDRLASGRLPFRQVVDVGLQIADALQSAHSKGITHRDIKPANIFLGNDGRAKILDFGLAKFDASLDAVDALVDTTTARLSTPGMTVGTVAYMSPEQAVGRPIDTRTDLFSFGLVLYEMATGHQAFAGTGVPALPIGEPRWPSTFAPDIPQQFDRIVQQALEMDPELRYQTAAELRTDLKRLKRDTERQSARSRELDSAPPRAPRGALAAAAPLLLPLAAAIVACIVTYVVAVQLASNVTELKPLLTDARFSQLTDLPGVEGSPSLSPDGKSVVYTSAISGNWDIYLQRVDGKRTIDLTADSPADDTDPAFSPDGSRIVFRSEREGGGIFVMGATGESVKRISNFGYNPAWSPDAKFVVCATEHVVDDPTSRMARSELWIVDVSTGQTRRLTTMDAVQPHWSPHGDRIAFWSVIDGQRDMWTVGADSSQPMPVTQDVFLDWNPVWSPQGDFLFFSSDRAGSPNLWRVRLDEHTGKVLAPPEAVNTPSSNSGFVSVSKDGSRIAYLYQSYARNVFRVPFDAARGQPRGAPVAVTRGAHEVRGPNISPDGQWVTFAWNTRIAIARVDGSALRELSEDAYLNRAPRWSPDGKTIAFYSNRSGTYQIWTVRPDGSNLQQLTNQPQGLYYPVWSPDGQTITTTSFGGKTFVVNVGNTSNTRPLESLPSLPEPGASFVAWSWSPSGRKLAGWRLQPDGTSLGIVIYEPELKRYRQLTDAGAYPTWLSDDRRLLFAVRDKFLQIDLGSGKTQAVPIPTGLLPDLALSRDGRWLYFSEDQREGDVWLVTMPAAARRAATSTERQ